MSKKGATCSDVLAGLFILFSALALAAYNLQMIAAGEMEPMDALPAFGFALLLVFAGLAKATGRWIYCRTVFFLPVLLTAAFWRRRGAPQDPPQGLGEKSRVVR